MERINIDINCFSDKELEFILNHEFLHIALGYPELVYLEQRAGKTWKYLILLVIKLVVKKEPILLSNPFVTVLAFLCDFLLRNCCVENNCSSINLQVSHILTTRFQNLCCGRI